MLAKFGGMCFILNSSSFIRKKQKFCEIKLKIKGINVTGNFTTVGKNNLPKKVLINNF